MACLRLITYIIIIYLFPNAYIIIIINMQKESELESTLRIVVRPEFHSKLSTWISTSSREEQRGLLLIRSIYKHKGTKKFRTRCSTSQSTRSIKTAAEEIQSRYLKSTYDSEFSALASDDRAALFEYRKLADLPCSHVLTPVSLMFIDNWLKLKDFKEYQDLVLKCLRSLAAMVKSSDRLLPEYQRKFTWNDPSKNFTNHRTDHVNSTIQLVRASTASRPWVRPKTVQTQDMNIKPLTLTKEDIERRKQALMKGSNVVGKWIISPTNSVSQYQETFVTHFQKYEKSSRPDFHTSISLGRLCPNKNL